MLFFSGFSRLASVSLFIFSPILFAADEHGHDEHEEEGRVHLTAEQIQSAEIVVSSLSLQPVVIEVEVPAELAFNLYASSQVSPRIDAQVIKRHVRLGHSVKIGDALVTLSSVAMAEKQSDLLLRAKEWQRLKKLGKQLVTGRSYEEARLLFEQARGQLLAYGMTKNQVKSLIRKNKISQASGQFTLLSSQTGTVVKDDFVTGQMAAAGQALFEITDESKLWVTAQVNPQLLKHLHIGFIAQVKINQQLIKTKIIQIDHRLDEKTRTMAVRLELENQQDAFHAGQFVSVIFQAGQSANKQLSLPLDAVLRSPDGDWQVFVEEEAGEFEPQEIELLQQTNTIAVIAGLDEGTRVVTQGAFFVQSELAKAGFEVHNH